MRTAVRHKHVLQTCIQCNFVYGLTNLSRAPMCHIFYFFLSIVGLNILHTNQRGRIFRHFFNIIFPHFAVYILFIFHPDVLFCSRLDWPVRTLSFSYDGKMLASASEDLVIDIAEVETGKGSATDSLKLLFSHYLCAFSLQFLSDSLYFHQ